MEKSEVTIMQNMENGKTISLSQALEIFSDVLPLVQSALQDNMIADISAIPVVKKTKNATLLWVRTEVRAEMLRQCVAERSRVIKRIVARMNPVARKGNTITDEDIAMAREVPIEDLYDGRLFKSGGKSKCGLCPFHVEKTPSFHIYKDNRYKCFGCQEYGDAISFYMKIHNVKFINAVKELSNAPCA